MILRPCSDGSVPVINPHDGVSHEEIRSPEPQVTFDAFAHDEDLYNDAIPILFGDARLVPIGYEQKGTHSNQVFQTPNGSPFWVPKVKPDLRPVVGTIYQKWDNVVQMFQLYAGKSGFSIHVGPYKTKNGVITHRTLMCNKAGKSRRSKPFDSGEGSSSGPSRRSYTTVIDCKCILRLRAVKGTPQCELYYFHEKHNHEMVSSDDMDLTRKGHHIKFEDIRFVHTMYDNKIGPHVAHRLQTALKGGHENMHATRSAYCNISRDIKLYIGNRDMQIFVKQMEDLVRNLPNFSFDFFHDGCEVKSISLLDNRQ